MLVALILTLLSSPLPPPPPPPPPPDCLTACEADDEAPVYECPALCGEKED